MFPETTSVFDTGKRPITFAHGGNSLQERAIPVMTVIHRAAAGGSTLAMALPRKAGRRRRYALPRGKVDVVDQGALDFGSARDLDCPSACRTSMKCRLSCVKHEAMPVSSVAQSGDCRRAPSSSFSACLARPMHGCASRCPSGRGGGCTALRFRRSLRGHGHARAVLNSAFWACGRCQMA